MMGRTLRGRTGLEANLNAAGALERYQYWSDKLERLLEQQRSRAEGHQRYCDNTLDTAALDAELRAALAEEVFPEFVEIEFARERVCFAQKPIAATKKWPCGQPNNHSAAALRPRDPRVRQQRLKDGRGADLENAVSEYCRQFCSG